MDLSKHYAQRYTQCYSICMAFMSFKKPIKTWEKWLILMNYYQDMILYHGVSTENNLLGLSNNTFTKQL